MRINEASLGPVYLASDDSIQKWFWPHVAAIHEMCEPYRRGRAVILPTGRLRFLALGIWTRSLEEDIDVDFPNDWADWMQSWDIDDNETSPPWVSGGGKLKPRVEEGIESPHSLRSKTNRGEEKDYREFLEEEGGPRGAEEPER